jgi:hypothetical protein
MNSLKFTVRSHSHLIYLQYVSDPCYLRFYTKVCTSDFIRSIPINWNDNCCCHCTTDLSTIVELLRSLYKQTVKGLVQYVRRLVTVLFVKAALMLLFQETLNINQYKNVARNICKYIRKVGHLTTCLGCLSHD